MASMTGGQAIVECLKREGVTHVFGIAAHTFLSVLDAMHGDPEIHYVGVRHEQTAAFMADGFARIANRPGVCLAVAGPGGTNLLTGIAGAHVANSPVIAMVGGIDQSSQYKDALQELDLLSMYRPLTKLSFKVNLPERIPELLQLAFRTARSGRRGPVFVELPQDVSTANHIRLEIPDKSHSEFVHRQPGDRQAIQEATKLLNQANRPLCLAGGGVTTSQAGTQVMDLAKLLSIPVVTTYGQNDAVPNDDPLYIGPLGRAGSIEASRLCLEADLLLVIGSRLGHFETFFDNRYIRPGTHIIQIDVDEKYIGQVFPVSVGITGDAKTIVTDLIQAVKEERPKGSSKLWQRQAKDLRDSRIARLDGEGSMNAKPMKPQRVYHELRRALPAEAIVTVDGGACAAYGYDRLSFTHPRTFLAPLDLGCIGWAFPVALGAKIAKPGVPVVSINGDGGYLMQAKELATAAQENIPTVAIVMNNGSWGSEKAYQRDFYDSRYVGADITSPSFAQHARLFGAKGYCVEHPSDIGDVVKEAISLDISSVIEIPVDPNELPTPPHAVKSIHRTTEEAQQTS